MAQLELRAEQLSAAVSDALVDQAREERRRYDELTPLGVERGGRLGGNRLVERAALLLELRDVVADRNKHVAIGRKFRLVADRIAVARDDDRLVSHGGNVCISGLDHPVDVTAG